MRNRKLSFQDDGHPSPLLLHFPLPQSPILLSLTLLLTHTHTHTHSLSLSLSLSIHCPLFHFGSFLCLLKNRQNDNPILIKLIVGCVPLSLSFSPSLPLLCSFSLSLSLSLSLTPSPSSLCLHMLGIATNYFQLTR